MIGQVLHNTQKKRTPHSKSSTEKMINRETKVSEFVKSTRWPTEFPFGVKGFVIFAVDQRKIRLKSMGAVQPRRISR
jgi:hypothetical protein